MQPQHDGRAFFHGTSVIAKFSESADLYRHAVELKLKELINLATRIECLLPGEYDQAVRKDSHSLQRLWKRAKRAILHFWPKGDDTEINAVEAIIQELHDVDRDGQTLRYPAERNGDPNRYEQLPEFIGMENLLETMDRLFCFLDGCLAAFGDAHDALHSVCECD